MSPSGQDKLGPGVQRKRFIYGKHGPCTSGLWHRKQTWGPLWLEVILWTLRAGNEVHQKPEYMAYIFLLHIFPNVSLNLICWVRGSKNATDATSSPIPELSTPQYWVFQLPYWALASKQPADVNGFLPRHSGAHFLSPAPEQYHTMTNTTHISSLSTQSGWQAGWHRGYLFLSEAHK